MDQSERRRQITKVAKLYYYGHMTQDEIATMMNISRPKVSRYLSAAHKYNIVQITIKDPLFSNTETAERLEQLFHLKKVIVVPAGQTLEESKDNIGIAASDFLNEHLEDHIKIGISWGTTLNAFVHRFQAARKIPNACIAQMLGGTYSQTMHIDGREMVRTLAEKLSCQHSIIQAPMLVHNPTLRDLLMEEPEMITHFDLLNQLDMAFVGIGSSNYKGCVAYKAQYITEKEAKELYSTALTDICGHNITKDGTEAITFLTDRLMSISLDVLKQIPLVIGLCAGNDKAPSILSSIRGGYINGLIIDEIAAISLLETQKAP